MTEAGFCIGAILLTVSLGGCASLRRNKVQTAKHEVVARIDTSIDSVLNEYQMKIIRSYIPMESGATLSGETVYIQGSERIVEQIKYVELAQRDSVRNVDKAERVFIAPPEQKRGIPWYGWFLFGGVVAFLAPVLFRRFVLR